MKLLSAQDVLAALLKVLSQPHHVRAGTQEKLRLVVSLSDLATDLAYELNKQGHPPADKPVD